MAQPFNATLRRQSQPARADVLDLWSDAPGRGAAPVVDFALIRSFLVRRWSVIALTAILTAGSLAVLSRFMFNKYSTSALIMVDPRNARVTQGQDVLPGIGADAFAIESVVQVAKSDGFMAKVVDKLGLAQDDEFGSGQNRTASAVDKLKSRLSINRRGATYIIEVAAVSTVPVKAKNIANGVADLIVEDQARIRSESTDRAIAWLSNRIQELQDKLRRSENAAASLKAKLELTDAGQGYTLQERRVDELNKQYVLASVRLNEARARRDQLRNLDANPRARAPSNEPPVLTGLRQDLARLTRQSADQASVLGERHPEVLRTRSQIANLRQQIRTEIANLRAAAESDVREAEKREEAVSQQLRNAQTQSGEKGQEAVQLAELEREAKADRGVFEQLLARLKELTETRNLKLNDVRVASAALTPLRVSGPKLPVIAIGGLGLGLLFGFGFAGFLELRGGAGRRPGGMLPKKIGFPVAAILPKVAPAELNRSDDLVAEALQPGLTSLLKDIAGAQIVFVTSAHEGAGKSTVAALLAAERARQGEEVLLIEGASGGRATREFGLLDVVKSGQHFDDAITGPTYGNYFRVALGGSMRSSDSRIEGLLRSPDFTRAMKRYMQGFALIVIDGPSIEETRYWQVFAEIADKTILVVAKEEIDSDATQRSFRLLPESIVALNLAEAAEAPKPAPAPSGKKFNLSRWRSFGRKAKGASGSGPVEGRQRFTIGA